MRPTYRSMLTGRSRIAAHEQPTRPTDYIGRHRAPQDVPPPARPAVPAGTEQPEFTSALALIA